MDNITGHDSDRELATIAEAARKEFRNQRRTNPMLWIPGLRAAKAREIAIDAGADSGATTQLVTDRVLGKKRPNVGRPVVLKL
jgi:hypothetical protein